MKKNTFLIALLTLVLTSCNNERIAFETIENMQTPEMSNFQKAFRSLGELKNRPTAEEIKAQSSPELSDRRKDILLPSSKELIISSGVTYDEMLRKTNGDKAKIINWAREIYVNKINQLNQNIKNGN